MDNLIDFADLTVGNKAIKKIAQAFTRAGAPVVSMDADGKARRSSGVSYRSLFLTFADGQKIEMQIKSSGDIFAVKLNGSIQPLKVQDDQPRAVAELVKYLDAGRAKHQAKLARIKTALPKGIKTAAPRMEVALQAKASQIDTEIAQARETVKALREELGEQAMDSAVLDATNLTGKAKIWAIFDHWFEKDGHWMFGVKGKVKAESAWKKDGIEGLPSYPGARTEPALDSAILDSISYDKAKKAVFATATVADGFGGKTADVMLALVDGEVVEVTKTGAHKAGFKADSVEEAMKKAKAFGNGRYKNLKQSESVMDSASEDAKNSGYLQMKVGDEWEYVFANNGGKVVTTKEKNKSLRGRDLKHFSSKFGNDEFRVVAFKSGKVLDGAGEPADDAPDHYYTIDSAEFKEAIELAEIINGGVVLDSAAFDHAKATLQIALDTVETNLPFSIERGDAEQAELQRKSAESFKAALAVLDCGCATAEPDAVAGSMPGGPLKAFHEYTERVGQDEISHSNGISVADQGHGAPVTDEAKKEEGKSEEDPVLDAADEPVVTPEKEPLFINPFRRA